MAHTIVLTRTELRLFFSMKWFDHSLISCINSFKLEQTQLCKSKNFLNTEIQWMTGQWSITPKMDFQMLFIWSFLILKKIYWSSCSIQEWVPIRLILRKLLHCSVWFRAIIQMSLFTKIVFKVSLILRLIWTCQINLD